MPGTEFEEAAPKSQVCEAAPAKQVKAKAEKPPATPKRPCKVEYQSPAPSKHPGVQSPTQLEATPAKLKKKKNKDPVLSPSAVGCLSHLTLTLTLTLTLSLSLSLALSLFVSLPRYYN